MISVAVAFPKSKTKPPTIDDPTKYCRMSTWFLALGVITVMYRVYRAVQFCRDKMILARQVLCPLLLLMTVALGTTIVLELMYLPDYQIIETYGYCYPLGSIESKAHTIGQIVLEIPLQIAILMFAWKLRNLNETIGESRRISHLSCFQLGAWIIYLGRERRPRR